MDSNGWSPIETAPKRKGENGKPFRIIVTYAPADSTMPPLNVVHWGRGKGGKQWLQVRKEPLRYQPTHWRPMLDMPVVESSELEK